MLKRLLLGSPDYDFIVNGLETGFDLCFEGERVSTIGKNSMSVNANLQAARDKVRAELKQGRIAGPFSSPPFPVFKVAPLALREKATPGKFRLLHDLSHPYDDRSTNAGIPDGAAKVSYASIKDAIDIVKQYECAFMAKADIKDAYRNLPISVDSQWLVGFKLDGATYHDLRIPMGARSSCFIFERFSGALKYILHNTYKVKHIVKLLDDFLFIGETKQECQMGLDAFLHLCNWINLPVAHDKTIEPNTKVTFLGIDLDSANNVASIPREKISKYKEAVRELQKLPVVRVRQLREVIGKLQFVTSIIRGGRCFLRRLHDALIGDQNNYRLVTLSPEMRADLRTWVGFMDLFNGRGFITYADERTGAMVAMGSDASKTGYGGYLGAKVIAGVFPKSWQEWDIEALELYPILALVATFRRVLAGKTVRAKCDNLPLVHCLNKLTSKNKQVMRLMRPLVLILLAENIVIRAEYISSEDNHLCDTLSRQQVGKDWLLSQGKEAHLSPLASFVLARNLKLQ